MEFYNVYLTTYLNGVEIKKERVGKTLLAEEPVEKTHSLTWDNLEELYQKGVHCDFTWETTKKGRKISFFNEDFPATPFIKPIKEWKTPTFDLVVKISYQNISNAISIADILKWPNSIDAINYLKEKSLPISIDKPL